MLGVGAGALLPAEYRRGEFHTESGIVEQLKHLNACEWQQRKQQQQQQHLLQLYARAELLAVYGHEASESEVVAL